MSACSLQPTLAYAAKQELFKQEKWDEAIAK
jgi:hypothetical protein